MARPDNPRTRYYAFLRDSDVSQSFGLIPTDIPKLLLRTPPALEYWQAMLPIASAYWQEVAMDGGIDEEFQGIARLWHQQLQDLARRF